MVAQVPSVLVVRPGLAVNTVADLVALARQGPGKLTFASSGSGTTLHLSGELFKQQAKVFIVHIPYRGTAPATQDVAAGNVDMIFAALPSVMPLARSGKLRALAVTQGRRSRAAPELPTVAEAGAGLGLDKYEVTPWSACPRRARRPPTCKSACLSQSVRRSPMRASPNNSPSRAPRP